MILFGWSKVVIMEYFEIPQKWYIIVAHQHKALLIMYLFIYMGVIIILIYKMVYGIIYIYCILIITEIYYMHS